MTVSARLREGRPLNSEAMKNLTAGVLVCVAGLVAPVVQGGEEPRCVVGVNVTVKQVPSKRDVTNAWGIFALEPLPAGSYTLSFKARPANKSRGITKDNVLVATAYSIKIEGTKCPVKQTGLRSDKLIH